MSTDTFDEKRSRCMLGVYGASFFKKDQVPEEQSTSINHTSFSVGVFTMVEKTVKVKLVSRGAEKGCCKGGNKIVRGIPTMLHQIMMTFPYRWSSEPTRDCSCIQPSLIKRTVAFSVTKRSGEFQEPSRWCSMRLHRNQGIRDQEATIYRT